MREREQEGGKGLKTLTLRNNSGKKEISGDVREGRQKKNAKNSKAKGMNFRAPYTIQRDV